MGIAEIRSGAEEIADEGRPLLNAGKTLRVRGIVAGKRKGSQLKSVGDCDCDKIPCVGTADYADDGIDSQACSYRIGGRRTARPRGSRPR